MTTRTIQAQNILGELDRRIGLFRYAQDRASFWHEFFFVQSVEEYLLFLWLEADAAEVQGNTVAQGSEETQQKTALDQYARAALFRRSILALLQGDYQPFLPAWIDALGDRSYGQEAQQEDEAIFPDIEDQVLTGFADQETTAGNSIVSQRRHFNNADQCQQATHHYRAAARAYRRLIGGWLPQYAAGLPRVTLDAVDLADLTRLTRRLQEVHATIAKLSPQMRDPYVDQVAETFHLGMVGSGRHTRALNERKMAALDRSIATANKLAPFSQERTRLLKQIEEVWSGRNGRRRKRKAAEDAWLRQAQLRVQQAQKGDYVLDSAFGVVRIVRRNQKSLTIETKSGYREARPFDQILDSAPDPSQPPQATSEDAASEAKPTDHLHE